VLKKSIIYKIMHEDLCVVCVQKYLYLVHLNYYAAIAECSTIDKAFYGLCCCFWHCLQVFPFREPICMWLIICLLCRTLQNCFLSNCIANVFSQSVATMSFLIRTREQNSDISFSSWHFC